MTHLCSFLSCSRRGRAFGTFRWLSSSVCVSVCVWGGWVGVCGCGRVCVSGCVLRRVCVLCGVLWAGVCEGTRASTEPFRSREERPSSQQRGRTRSLS